MKLIYKNYEEPTIFLNENGYLTQFQTFIPENSWGEVSNYDNIKYVKTEHNTAYFSEAEALTKINNNTENYFDFNKAIIDIGANVGVYSIRSLFKNVYAFEPNKVIYSLLNVNLLIHDVNRFLRSKTYNVCLSDKHEIIEYDGSRVKQEDDVLYNDISYEHDNTRYIDNMETHTLDEYNCENVGFIKIDVEGYEEKILRGGIGTIIRNNYPPILFELWDVGRLGMTQERHDSLEKFLTDLGYNILWYWGDFETHLAIHP